MSRPHQHRAKDALTTIWPFSGAVANPQNQAAHGNICEVHTCRCGATRSTNVNGWHTERGTWQERTGEDDEQ